MSVVAAGTGTAREGAMGRRKVAVASGITAVTALSAEAVAVVVVGRYFRGL